MEIRRKAWHYWFYDLGHQGRPPYATNLCSYFWRVVFGVFLAVVMCAAVFFLIGLVGFTLYCLSLIMFYAFESYPSSSSAVLGGMVLVSLLVYRRSLPAGKRSAPKPPGLLRSYLRAKKDKVCPLVTFRDDPETQPGEMPEGC